MQYQPYYAAYLRTTNNPTNWDFMAWIGQRWREWEKLNGLAEHQPKTEVHRASFGAWLTKGS